MTDPLEMKDLNRMPVDFGHEIVRLWREFIQRLQDEEQTLLPVTEDDDDGVIGVDEDLDVRTAPLGVMSGAVVGVVTGCPSC